jgi:uncharacterized protein YjbI with pentapeptide repeats
MIRCGPYPAAGPRGPLDRVAQIADRNLRKADLGAADLSGADLYGADLFEAFSQ